MVKIGGEMMGTWGGIMIRSLLLFVVVGLVLQWVGVQKKSNGFFFILSFLSNGVLPPGSPAGI